MESESPVIFDERVVCATWVDCTRVAASAHIASHGGVKCVGGPTRLFSGISVLTLLCVLTLFCVIELLGDCSAKKTNASILLESLLRISVYADPKLDSVDCISVASTIFMSVA